MCWPGLYGRASWASHVPTDAVTFKRRLFLFRRWLGVGLGLLFVMWPLSGMVMMYVGVPELTENERHADLPVLDPEQIGVGRSKLWQRASPDAPVTQFSPRSSVSSRPAYLLKRAGHPWSGLFYLQQTHPDWPYANQLILDSLLNLGTQHRVLFLGEHA